MMLCNVVLSSAVRTDRQHFDKSLFWLGWYSTCRYVTEDCAMPEALNSVPSFNRPYGDICGIEDVFLTFTGLQHSLDLDTILAQQLLGGYIRL